MKKTVLRHKLNYNDFSDVIKPEVAYFLGFLWADGFVRDNSIRIELETDDFMDIWPTLQKIGFVTFSKRDPRKNWKSTCILVCGIKKIFDLLGDLDFVKKSVTAPIKVLKHIPENLHSYFFRGYFDGDGSISFKARGDVVITLTANYHYDWSFINDLFSKIGITKCYFSRNKCLLGGNSNCVLYSQKNQMKFLYYIYHHRDSDNIGLMRKYERFKTLSQKDKNKRDKQIKQPFISLTLQQI